MNPDATPQDLLDNALIDLLMLAHTHHLDFDKALQKARAVARTEVEHLNESLDRV